MSKFLIAIFSTLISALVAVNGEAQTEYLVTVDASTGAFQKIDSLPGIKWIAGESTIDERNHIFYSKLSNDGVVWRLLGISCLDGTIKSNTLFPSNSTSYVISKLQYGNSTNTLYAIQSFIDKVNLVSIDPTTGVVNQISLLSDITLVNDISFDNNTGRIILNGRDLSGKSALFSFNAVNGNLVSKFVSSTTVSPVFSNSLNKVFGLIAGVNLASVNTNNGVINTVNKLPGVTGATGRSTFDEKNENYIFIGPTQNSTSSLFTVNVNTGSILYQPGVNNTANIMLPNVIEHRFDNGLNKLFALHWEPTTAPFIPSIEIKQEKLSCNFYNFSFTSNITGSTIKKWDFGDGSVSTDSLSNHLYNLKVDSVLVKLLVVRAGRTDTAYAMQWVQLQKLSKVDFSYPMTSCLGTPTAFSINNTNVYPRIDWDFGDGSPPSNRATTINNYKIVGTFQVRLNVVDSIGCLQTVIHQLQVFSIPKVNAGNDKTVELGNTTILNGIVAGDNLSYHWYPALDLDDPLKLQPLCATKVNREYVLDAVDGNGCKNADSVEVTVVRNIVIPNAFSPNGDGINDVWNIQNLNNYPKTGVKIYNRYGQLLFDSNGYNKPWDGTYKGSKLPFGTYYYIIEF